MAITTYEGMHCTAVLDTDAGTVTLDHHGATTPEPKKQASPRVIGLERIVEVDWRERTSSGQGWMRLLLDDRDGWAPGPLDDLNGFFSGRDHLAPFVTAIRRAISGTMEIPTFVPPTHNSDDPTAPERTSKASAAPQAPTGPPYRLWSVERSPWPDLEAVGTEAYADAAARLLPDLSKGSQESLRDFELIPESRNRRGPFSVSIRADGQTLGFLPRDDAQRWITPLQRIVDAGLTPIVNGRIWAYLAVDWDHLDRHGHPHRAPRVWLRVGLGDPETALPFNDPPADPYTLLPRSAILQVTKEEQYADALLPLVPAHGHGMGFATLEEFDASTARTTRSAVAVKIDGTMVGQLTPHMSQRFLPMIEHFRERGLLTACWADITGSPVAAEVRIDAIKANEADAEFLDGPPRVFPRLGITPLADAGEHNGSDQTPVDLDDQQGRPETSAPRATAPTPVPPPPSVPAGWYPDADDSVLQRYWDGTQWTEHTAPRLPEK